MDEVMRSRMAMEDNATAQEDEMGGGVEVSPCLHT